MSAPRKSATWDQALALATEYGIRFYPGVPGEKRPLFKSGREAEHGETNAFATTDEAKLCEWAEQYPDAETLVRTGPELVCLDADCDEWVDRLRGLNDRHGHPLILVEYEKDGIRKAHAYGKPNGVRLPLKRIPHAFDLQSDGAWIRVRGEEADLLLEAGIPEVPEALAREVLGWFGPETTTAHEPTMHDGHYRAGERHYALRREAVRLVTKHDDAVALAMLRAFRDETCEAPHEKTDAYLADLIASARRKFDRGDPFHEAPPKGSRPAQPGPDEWSDLPPEEKVAKVQSILGPPRSLAGWEAVEPVEWLLEGLLQRGSLAFASATGGLGKSLLLQLILAKLAAGGPPDDRILGLWKYPDRPLKIVIIEAENGLERLKRRLKEFVLGGALTAQEANRALENIVVYPAEGLAQRHLVIPILAMLAETREFDIVVLDPWRSFLPPSVEDDISNLAIGRTADDLVAFCKAYHRAVLVVAHDNRGLQALRGASSQRDATEILLHLTNPDEQDPNYILGVLEKIRDAAEVRRFAIQRTCYPKDAQGFYPVTFDWTEERTAAPAGTGADAVSTSIRVRRFLVDRPGDWFKAEAIARGIEQKLSTVRGVLPALAHGDRTVQQAEARHVLPHDRTTAKVYRYAQEEA